MTRHLTPLGRALVLIVLAGIAIAVWTVVPHPPLPAVRVGPGFVPGVVVGVVASVAAGILLAVVAWVALRRAVLRALGSRPF